jgi:hypothetical protein
MRSYKQTSSGGNRRAPSVTELHQRLALIVLSPSSGRKS